MTRTSNQDPLFSPLPKEGRVTLTELSILERISYKLQPTSYQPPITNYQPRSINFPPPSLDGDCRLRHKNRLFSPLLPYCKPVHFMLCSHQLRTYVLSSRTPTTKGALIMSTGINVSSEAVTNRLSAVLHTSVCGQA